MRRATILATLALIAFGALFAFQRPFREFLSRYYTEHLRFGFVEKEKEGLRIFANLCIKHGLLSKRDLAFRVV